MLMIYKQTPSKDSMVDSLSKTVSREAAREQTFAQMRQKERFNWLAERMASRLEAHSVEELEALLDSDPVWPGQWEKAIVMLALKATPEAIFVLEHVDTAEASNSFRALHDRCLIEARRRMYDRG